MKSFAEILERARQLGPKRVAVAGAPDDQLRAALASAEGLGIAVHQAYGEPHEAVEAVRRGEADVLMKGDVETRVFMGAVLDGECGLRGGKLVSHVAVLEVGGRLLLVTDGGIVLNPALEEKAEIILNALPLARALGIAEPRVSVLAAVEKVNPKMPETVDAAELAKRGIPGCRVAGPHSVDVAISPEAARAKGVADGVAGHADILLVPSVLVGNTFCKGIMYFAACRFGGVVAGTSRPVAFLSRADTAETKLNTIALGILMCGECEHG
ncbi:phosphate butyryltransferase [Candidatus Poribacteria bacterium]|nr:phosphate butyryltransferase [Candidatus Poribacteria bacterium]